MGTVSQLQKTHYGSGLKRIGFPFSLAQEVKVIAVVSIIQGIFYLITGIWPLVSRRTFERVTGPKLEFWLAKTVGILISVIGGVLIQAGLRQRRLGDQLSPEIPPLAIGSAAGLTTVDFVYVVKKRISPVYLLDAAAELGLIGLWTAALWREIGGEKEEKK